MTGDVMEKEDFYSALCILLILALIIIISNN